MYRLNDRRKNEVDSKVVYHIDSPRLGGIYNQETTLSGWVYSKLDGASNTKAYLEFESNNRKVEIRLDCSRPDVREFLSSKNVNDNDLDSFGSFGFSARVSLAEVNSLYLVDGGMVRLLETLYCVRSRKTSVLIGHSASGKSAFLQAAGLDRWLHDADSYFSQSGKEESLGNVISWMGYPKDHSFVVLSNNRPLLKEFLSLKNVLFGVRFVYLKRPFNVYRQNINKVNTDGLKHKVPAEEKLREMYDSFASLYEGLADETVSYDGNDLEELGRRVRKALHLS